MSAPVKPWESHNYQRGDFSSLANDMAASPIADRVQSVASCLPTPGVSTQSTAPQLPPRPSEQSSALNSRLGYGSNFYGGYNGMGMGYSGFSSPLGYGGYSSPYSSYGGYSGYNRFGPDFNSTFARHAEESSRPAFESINSIVQAVNSVGMMLDSTFQAVYNSFRAVIGVADNFSRLKTQLVQVFSALAFIRTLRYFIRRVLELLRLRPRGDADRLWREAVQEAAAMSAGLDAPGGGVPSRSSWPILMFFGIIMGGPYLIWKVISAFSGPSEESAWAKGETDHYVATANFNFRGEGSEELSFSAGQHIIIAPKELQPRVRGWLLASVDGKKTGMIPANYVKVMGRRRGSKNSSEPAQIPSAPTQSMAAIPESQLESAFPSPLPAPSAAGPVSGAQDQSVINQEAADILNEKT